jgi:hypothetical protein
MHHIALCWVPYVAVLAMLVLDVSQKSWRMFLRLELDVSQKSWRMFLRLELEISGRSCPTNNTVEIF